MTFSCFEEQLASKPDALAITDLSQARSWRELDDNVRALTRYLTDEAGLQPGEHVALLVGNRIEYVEAMLAGLLAGLWVTPINTHLTASEVDYIRRDCGAKIIFHDDALAPLLLADSSGTAVNIQQLLPTLPIPAQSSIEADSPAGGNMLYTSGTTGRPKGVKRARPARVDEMIARMRGFGEAFGLTGRGPHLVTGPLYHAAPGLFAIYDMLNGAPVVIMPKWSCETFFKAVGDYRVVTTHLVPTMFVRLLEARERGEADDANLSSLDYVLHGAAPISRSVKQRMIDWWGPMLTEYWGATESGTVTMVNSADWLAHPGTVGKPLPHFEVFVGDATGEPVDAPEGLLLCRHKTLAGIFEYHNDPEKTRKSHPLPHVVSLGDIGRVEDGFVYLSDRESNMIISGGVNIYPAEIEEALMEHPQIVDAVVFGIPNEEWGEEVKAVVQLRDGTLGTDALVEDIRGFTRARVAGFKVPRSIAFIDVMPRNPAGKIPVRELKAKYAG